MSLDQQIEFVISGPLVPWQRMKRSRSSRLDGRGVRTYKDPAVAAYQEMVAGLVKVGLAQWRRKTKRRWRGDGSFGLTLGLRQQDLIGRDIDNIAKCIMDAMEPIAYNNDKQVNELHIVRVLDREDPGAFVTVWRHEHNPMEDK